MAGAGDTLASSTGPPASTTSPPGQLAGDITLHIYTQYLSNIYYLLSIHNIYTVLVVAEPAPPRPSTPPWHGPAPPRTGHPPGLTTRRRSASLSRVSTISIIVSTISIIVSTQYIYLYIYGVQVYTQSRVVLRYVGHPDHRARDRNYNIGGDFVNFVKL